MMHCSCGCGGKAWRSLLRDPETRAVRHYAPTVETLTDRMPHQPALRAAVHDHAAALCGTPMTRLHVECRKWQTFPPPHLDEYVGVEDGVPVYDLAYTRPDHA